VGDPVPSAGPQHGRVASFDPARGLGEVLADDGSSFGFHATAIADGSRAIEVGAAVTFTVAPGHRGRYEVQSLTPAGVSHQRPE
jgi:cold shock CspA family protein